MTGAANGVVKTAVSGSGAGTAVSTTVANLRDVNITSGQLYVSTSSGTAVRIGAVGTGEPVGTGNTTTPLPGLPTSTGSPYAFFLADLSPSVAGVDTLYVADDSSTGGGILKYSLVSGSWTATGSATATAIRGLTGSVSGTTVSLYGTTGGGAAAGGGTLYSLIDSTGYNATLSGAATALATAGSNEAFRGIAFVPVAAVPEISSFAMVALVAVGGIAVRRCRRQRTKSDCEPNILN
jgi:hypothetical protein